MKFFTSEASAKIGTREGNAAWKKRIADYEGHLEQIKPKLTPGWRKLAGTDFHDRTIFAVEYPRKSELVLRIDMQWVRQQQPKKIFTLHFSGLVSARIPRQTIGATWIYDEVHLMADGVVQLIAALSECEISVVAHDVDCCANFEIKG